MTYDRNIQAYRETDLQTMGKERLIVLLYRKTLEHLAKAEDVAADDRVEMSRRLNLAQRIVSELRGALDHAVGGEIATNLDSLYGFVFNEILAMQVDRDAIHVANCREVLQPLLNAWSEIPAGSANRELSASDGTKPASSQSPDLPRDAGITPEQSFSFSA